MDKRLHAILQPRVLHEEAANRSCYEKRLHRRAHSLCSLLRRSAFRQACFSRRYATPSSAAAPRTWALHGPRAGLEKVEEIDVSPTVCRTPLEYQKVAYTHFQVFQNGFLRGRITLHSPELHARSGSKRVTRTRPIARNSPRRVPSRTRAQLPIATAKMQSISDEEGFAVMVQRGRRKNSNMTNDDSPIRTTIHLSSLEFLIRDKQRQTNTDLS